MKTWIKNVLLTLGATIAGSTLGVLIRPVPWVVMPIMLVGALIIAALYSWQAKKEAK